MPNNNNPDRYAASPSLIYFVSHLLPWLFTKGPLFAVTSDGYFPAMDPRYNALATLMIYTFNDVVGQHVLDPMLGSIENKRNKWALKLGICQEDANKLLIDPGQTVYAEIQTIYYRDKQGQQKRLTADVLMEQLGCSEYQALLMLAVKESDKSTLGRTMEMVSKLNLPRQAANIALAALFDAYLLQALVVATTKMFGWKEEHSAAFNEFFLLIACWALKDIAQRVSQYVEQYRLGSFMVKLRHAGNRLERPADFHSDEEQGEFLASPASPSSNIMGSMNSGSFGSEDHIRQPLLLDSTAPRAIVYHGNR